MSLLRAAATVGGFTMGSRVLGFVRDMLIARYLGAGPIADAFFVSFKLPNFFRQLFAEGAFSAAFVPLFSGLNAREGRARALAFAEEALSVLLVALLITCTLANVLMPDIIRVLAPGFVTDPQRFDLAVAFSRVTFPYLLFISLVSLYGGILNSVGRFAAVAATPIVLNIATILALLTLEPVLPHAGWALADGVLISGVAQFLWLAWACRREGIVLRLPRPRLGPDVARLLKLIFPAALGAGVVQINLVIGLILASLLPAGSISYLFYADRLNQLPIGVVGVAIGTALLPLLARQIAKGETDDAMQSQNRAIEMGLALSLPAAAGLLVLAPEIVATLFERGAFDAATTEATADALRAYTLGLPAYIMVRALSPGFYARQDTRTPVVFGAISIAANVALAFLTLGTLRHVGLALATAMAAWVNAACLGLTLVRRGHWRIDDRLRRNAIRLALAAAIMAALLLGLGRLLAPAFAGGVEWARIGAIALLLAAGLVCYGGATVALKALDVSELRRMMRRAPPPANG